MVWRALSLEFIRTYESRIRPWRARGPFLLAIILTAATAIADGERRSCRSYLLPVVIRGCCYLATTCIWIGNCIRQTRGIDRRRIAIPIVGIEPRLNGRWIRRCRLAAAHVIIERIGIDEVITIINLDGCRISPVGHRDILRREIRFQLTYVDVIGRLRSKLPCFCYFYCAVPSPRTAAALNGTPGRTGAARKYQQCACRYGTQKDLKKMG